MSLNAIAIPAAREPGPLVSLSGVLRPMPFLFYLQIYFFSHLFRFWIRSLGG